MNKKLATFFLALAVVVSPVIASADHSTEGAEASHSTTKVMTSVPSLSTGASVEQMETMIKLLTQLLDLLKHQAEHDAADADHHDDKANDDHDDEANDDHDDDANDDHEEDEDHADDEDDH
jgi:hypothetical protein